MNFRSLLRFWTALVLLCGVLALPSDIVVPASAQPPGVLRDAGPREGTPAAPLPVSSYGILLGLLVLGGGVGLAFVVVIRGWDRQRPTERHAEAEAAARTHQPRHPQTHR